MPLRNVQFGSWKRNWKITFFPEVWAKAMKPGKTSWNKVLMAPTITRRGEETNPKRPASFLKNRRITRDKNRRKTTKRGYFFYLAFWRLADWTSEKNQLERGCPSKVHLSSALPTPQESLIKRFEALVEKNRLLLKIFIILRKKTLSFRLFAVK